MSKAEVFATIKEANQMVDEMQGMDVNSEEYKDLNEALGWLLDTLMISRYYQLHVSKRTGHYWVTF